MNTAQHGWEGVSHKGAWAQSNQDDDLCDRCNLWIIFLVFLPPTGPSPSQRGLAT